MVAAMQMLGVATIGRYPGYNGDLHVTGKVAVGGLGDELLLSWNLEGVDALCANTPDGVKNACGVHIHSGKTCADASAVGGHFFNSEEIATDPWLPKVFKTVAGAANGMTTIRAGTSFDDVQDRALVVHDHTGSRVGCGIIHGGPADRSAHRISFQTYPGYMGYNTVKGRAFAWSTGGTAWLQYAITGIDTVCKDTPVGVANGCGIHIHSGKTCDDASQVGGHFYDKDSMAADPWSAQVYMAQGTMAVGLLPTKIGTDDIDGRALVVHDSTGARIACGIIPSSFQSHTPGVCPRR